MYVVSHTEVTRSLSEPGAFLRKLRFAKSLHQTLSQFGQKNYRSMLVPCHDTMPSFMMFRRIFDLHELKNQVLNISGRATMPRCLNFILISCMGPRNSPKDTHVIFQPTLVHRSICLQFRFGLCTLNVQKLN